MPNVPSPPEDARAPDFLAKLLDAAPVALVLTDASGAIRFANRAAEALFGHPCAMLAGQPVEMLVPDPSRTGHASLRSAYGRWPRPTRMGEGRDVRARRRDGTCFEAEVALTPLESGGRTWVLAAVADVTERRRLEHDVRHAKETLEQRVLERTAALEHVLAERETLLEDLRAQREALSRISREDALTGLANRREFDRRLEVEIRRADRDGTPLSVAMLDLDRFKSVNDRWGHAVGDAVLRESARLLWSQCRATDAIGRWGGEEFALALPSTDLAQAVHLCERIRLAFERHAWEALQPGLAVTLSAGIAQRHPGLDAEACVVLADAQLYRAKQGGRNRVEPAPAVVGIPAPRASTTSE